MDPTPIHAAATIFGGDKDHHTKAEAIVVHQLTPRVIVNALIDQLFVISLENGGFAERARLSLPIQHNRIGYIVHA